MSKEETMVETKRNLRAAEAREIRELFASGEAMDALASQFRISTSSVYQILKFHRWKNAGGPDTTRGWKMGRPQTATQPEVAKTGSESARAVFGPRQSEIERFWRCVERGDDDACWPWKGTTSTNQRGMTYGVVHRFGGLRGVRAHRASYRIHGGDIPAGMVIRHTCDNPICVNPAHLVIGTQLDNVRDREERGRSRYLRGENHHGSKFTAQDVARIRKAVSEGASKATLARQYGVSDYAIHYAVTKGWAHL